MTKLKSVLPLLRRVFFWAHLVVGVVAGAVLFVVCLSGTLWVAARCVDRIWPVDAGEVAAADGKEMLAEETLLERARAFYPEKTMTGWVVHAEENRCREAQFGRGSTVWVDPYSGEVRERGASLAGTFERQMFFLHRYLLLSGDARPYGKAIVGAATLGMVFLCVSGLWLWWPRKWTWRGVKSTVWFLANAKGRTRDWNWHNVFGFWSLAVMLVLAVTGVVISYAWATTLTYRLAGERIPEGGWRSVLGGQRPPQVSAEENVEKMSYAQLTAKVAAQYPDWEKVTFSLGGPQGEGRGRNAVAEENRPGRGAGQSGDSRGNWRGGLSAVTAQVAGVGRWIALQDFAELSLHPQTGEVLRTRTFGDYTPGTRLRLWARRLHDGTAFGATGEVVAGIFSLAGCVLVWTGFALTWRRFFGKKKSAGK